MAAYCFKCGKELALPEGPVGRTAECSACGSDARVCFNCKHYERSAYNECREPQSDRVLDKDRRNTCDYFSLRHGGAKGAAVQDPAADARKKLDDLFKK